MTPERWRQLEGMYDAVKDLSPAERNARLKDADPDLRSAVEAIFAQDGSALEHPAWEHHASLLQTVTVFSVGMLLGPYKIERKIGEGGMGEVYRATDTRLARAVAIKTCRQEFNERSRSFRKYVFIFWEDHSLTVVVLIGAARVSKRSAARDQTSEAVY